MYNNNEKISHEGEQRGQAIWNFEWMKGKKSDMVSFKKGNNFKMYTKELLTV